MSIRGFCQQEGLSEPGFHWWRRELERRRTTRASTRRQSKAASFVPLTVTPLEPSPAYEVFLPSGVRVLVHASAAEKLADVLSALEPPPC